MTSIATVKPPRELDYLSGQWVTDPTRNVTVGSLATFDPAVSRGILLVSNDVLMQPTIIEGFRVGSRYRCSIGGQFSAGTVWVQLRWRANRTGAYVGNNLRVRGSPLSWGQNGLPFSETIFTCTEQNFEISLEVTYVSSSIQTARFIAANLSFFEIEELP